MTTRRERQREYQRRRYEKRVARTAKSRERRRRIWIGAAVGVVVVLVAVTTVVLLVRGERAVSASPSGSGSASSAATSSASAAASPSATATVPAASLAENRTWTGSITLGQGTIGISLDGAKAPQAVANFTQLAAKGFYDGLTCHRLATSIKVLQCGDPLGTGSGGPGYTFGPIENAPADGVYKAGTIAMARVGGDASSQGSQFFIVYGDTTIPADSAGGYTVFGTVTSGLDVVQAIAAKGTADGSTDGKPAQTVTMEKVETK